MMRGRVTALPTLCARFIVTICQNLSLHSFAAFPFHGSAFALILLADHILGPSCIDFA
jgi:hypothetical protein